MLPALLAGMGVGAVGAGAKGIQDWVGGQDQEKEAKKQALRQLTAKFQNAVGEGDDFTPQTPIQKAPGFAETVVAPMVTAGVTNAANAGIGEMSKPENGLEAMASDDRNDTWYRDEARRSLGR